MTIRELNALRHAIFEAGMENAEIRNAVKMAGIAYLYEVVEVPDKHAAIVLTARTQMNNNTLEDYGFNPEQATARCLAVFHGQTKTAKF